MLKRPLRLLSAQSGISPNRSNWLIASLTAALAAGSVQFLAGLRFDELGAGRRSQARDPLMMRHPRQPSLSRSRQFSVAAYCLNVGTDAVSENGWSLSSSALRPAASTY